MSAGKRFSSGVSDIGFPLRSSVAERSGSRTEGSAAGVAGNDRAAIRRRPERPWRSHPYLAPLSPSFAPRFLGFSGDVLLVSPGCQGAGRSTAARPERSGRRRVIYDAFGVVEAAARRRLETPRLVHARVAQAGEL